MRRKHHINRREESSLYGLGVNLAKILLVVLLLLLLLTEHISTKAPASHKPPEQKPDRCLQYNAEIIPAKSEPQQ